MAKRRNPPGRIPVDEAATEAEINAAIEGLTDADHARLQRFARYRLRGVSRAQLKVRDWYDLLAEAFTRTLDGSRRWRKDVPFVHHLLGIMRSMADHWSTEANPDPAIPASRLERLGPEGEIESPYLEAGSGEPSQERALIAREELGSLRQHFENDDLAVLVIEGLAEGYRPSELSELLGAPESDIQAALKRVRRYGDRIFSKKEPR